MSVSPRLRLAFLLLAGVAIAQAWADERRAPAPKFTSQDLDGVFFEDLSEAFSGSRPSLSAVRQSSMTAANAPAVAANASDDSASSGDMGWGKLISPASIEDEVKRLKLHFDSIVTTPGAFNSGGYMEARLDLTVLAMMFAVINEYGGEVRWKDQAAAARDLLARTAFNCKAGSTQVYNEAKLRKGDLQDLVAGSGLSSRDAEPENDWGMIVDRSPLMEYGEYLIESLEDSCRNEASIKENMEQIRRQAQLISVFGEVITKEGLDEADDEDYVSFSKSMVDASKEVVAALEREDMEGIRKHVSSIRQRCDVCHEQFR